MRVVAGSECSSVAGTSMSISVSINVETLQDKKTKCTNVHSILLTIDQCWKLSVYHGENRLKNFSTLTQ